MRRWANVILGALIVTASAYTPMTYRYSGIGANGSQVKPGITTAVLRDLKHLMGKKIHIEGVGVRRVNDLMAAKWKCAIDVCVDTKGEANRFGRKKLAIKVMQ